MRAGASVLMAVAGVREMCVVMRQGFVALLLDGRWVMPPLACGLLPGVGRTLALREGRLSEAVVRVEDLPRIRGWAFLNSLRGWIAAEMV